MKKALALLIVSIILLTGCEKHGEYYKQCRSEVQEMASDAHEILELHLDGKMDDDEAERKLTMMYEDLNEMTDLNTCEDNVKMYIQFASFDISLGDTGVDQMHNLEDYL